jgi:hypothetical protein
MKTKSLNCKRVFGVVLMVFYMSGIALSDEGVKGIDDGLKAEDPMIKICSLPIDKNLDDVLAAISKDVSQGTGIKQEFITYYWVTLAGINWNGKKQVGRPILVDLYPAGFFDNKTIQSVMTNLAVSIEKNVGIDRKWVFIHTHFPNQGQVYISGQIQISDDYKGPENEAEYTGKAPKKQGR